MRKFALLVVGLAACSSGSDEPGAVVAANDAGSAASQPADFVGKWQFAGMTCDGNALVLTGYQETAEWTESTFHGEVSNSQCKVTFDNPIKVVDGKPKAADTPKVACAPAACSLSYSASAGADKINVTKKCPDDFLVTAADPIIEFSGETLLFTVKTGSTTCTSKYTRF